MTTMPSTGSNSTERRPDLRPRWAVLLLLLILPLILYGSFLFGGKALFWGTPSLQFWPWRQFAAEQLRAGRLPLWNPYTGNGTPLLADHQSAIFYPLNVIFWILPADYAMGWSLALHAILAGVAMIALARDLGLSRLGGAVAALALMFSGYMVARGSFLTEISALPWLPLIWLFTRRLLRSHRWPDLALLSLCVALQFLAGHAQTWFYSMWAMGLYAIWKITEIASGKLCPRNDNFPTPPWRWPLAGILLNASYLLLAVALGVMLAGVQFFPTLELSQLAGRGSRAEWASFSLQYSFWPWRLLTLFAPDFFGSPAQGDYWGYATYWEDAGYIGLLPFLLAILAVVLWFRRRKQADLPAWLREAPFWGGLALLALLLAMGKNTPLYLLLYRYVPGFGSFQAPARLLCIYTPAMALLAGMGIDTLRLNDAGRLNNAARPSERFGKLCVMGMVISLGALLAGAAATWLLPGVKATFIVGTIKAAAWAAAAFLLLFVGNLAWKLPAWRPYWSWAAVLFIAADLLVAGWSLNPAVDAALYRAPAGALPTGVLPTGILPTGIGAFLAQDGPRGRTFYFYNPRYSLVYEQYLTFDSFGPRDLAYWQGMREALPPDLGMVEHLPSANSFEPLVEGRYDALLKAIEEMPSDAALRTLGLMNVAYILDPESRQDMELAYRSPTVNVYRNPYVLPRAYVVYQAQSAATPEDALAALTAPDFDPASQVVLEPSHLQPANSPPATRNPQSEPCILLPSLPDQVKITAALTQPGYLVLADTYYPGWRAFVDGKPAEILRANVAFRAVALDAGEHEVRFEYRPVSFIIGLACSAAALAALAVGWVVAKTS